MQHATQFAKILYQGRHQKKGSSARANVPASVVRELLTYSPETGALTWVSRPAEVFDDRKGYAMRVSKTWNEKNAGKPAFDTLGTYGYLCGGIFGFKAFAHQIAWVFIAGAWPDEQIDHINGVYTDNRAVNLRAVSHAENGRNQKMNAKNTTGFRGVYYSERDKLWYAKIVYRQKQYHLGSSKSFDEAVQARLAAERRYGFHTNHGQERER